MRGRQPSAAALLAAAEGPLAERGVQRILGPIDLTPHDETGLLVRGFDTPATILSPYNPSYYGRLLESASYEPFRDYHSYAATADSAPSPAVHRILRAARTGRGVMKGVTLRNVDLRRWETEARIVCDIYNAAFARVWGSVPITWDEFAQRAQRLRAIIRGPSWCPSPRSTAGRPASG